MGLAAVVGLAGLAACLLGGITPRAWDAAALSAFSLEQPWAAGLATAIIVAAGAATALRSWPVMNIWLAAFAALAVLSTALDVRWERTNAADRNALASMNLKPEKGGLRVRLFTPDAHLTWLLASLDPADGDTAYGLIDLGLGIPELGTVKLSGLASIVGPRSSP